MNIPSKVYLLLRTHNRPKEFKRCIDSISNQSLLPEIIIISDDKIIMSKIKSQKIKKKIHKKKSIKGGSILSGLTFPIIDINAIFVFLFFLVFEINAVAPSLV